MSRMSAACIRPAKPCDLPRIAEIEIFNCRLFFYPIFQNDAFYFEELQVPRRMESYLPLLSQLWVYDDGAVKGFVRVEGPEIKKLFVEPVLQNRSIGAALLNHAVQALHASELWALEKNTRAIAFYRRHGFYPTGDRKPEEDTIEYLIRMERAE